MAKVARTVDILLFKLPMWIAKVKNERVLLNESLYSPPPLFHFKYSFFSKRWLMLYRYITCIFYERKLSATNQQNVNEYLYTYVSLWIRCVWKSSQHFLKLETIHCWKPVFHQKIYHTLYINIYIYIYTHTQDLP